MLTGRRLCYAQLRVLSSAPVDHHDDLAPGIINVDNDLFDERVDDLLLEAHIRRRGIPYSLEIGSQREQRRLVDKHWVCSDLGADASLAFSEL